MTPNPAIEQTVGERGLPIPSSHRSSTAAHCARLGGREWSALDSDERLEGRVRMLCANSYDKKYVKACRKRIEEQLSSYDRLKAGASMSAHDAAAEFEPHFFANMVLALESHFMHRARGKEGKDGNPLNEVRMISASLMANDGTLQADKTIKYDPSKSVLDIKIGDKIRVTQPGFKALSEAFFAQIESKFS
ncbi:MAG: hypothetical protein ACREYE_27135 [Gammaproteobacteria bacterium]